ncbi:M1 family aminopeptidase [Brumimicrobium oceani]|uniref:Aminopeptidase N n=1 Tax=Brumimicrobium oceani TaxID=2100725 RepID=A0A2U2XG76_9FLAO|nr:M1 family aminopeptidase [Brumimicrobium oceani]PWH86796.1 hypothetical protein DIT68_00605 [Brumimicrobium oceani]
MNTYNRGFLLITISILFNFSVLSQENHRYCSKRDAFLNAQLKSPNLNLQEIAQAKKYDVHFYALDVTMDNLSTDIAGTSEIHGITNENLDSVLFELFSSFTISEIRVDNSPTPFNRIGSTIKVPVNLLQNQNFKIAVDYNGTPPNSSTTPFGGSGMSNDSSPSWGNQVTWSLSEPFSAYEWFPVKQDLRDKADSVSVKITVPNNCKAGSNGVLENVVNLGNGTSRYEWFHRHPIAYYLISVAVAEYVEYNVTANPVGSPNPVVIQNYIYNNPSTLPYFQSDIDETVNFMELFAELFGRYPYDDEKYGHCMAPLSGGMEHQTMTTQGFFEKGLTAHELGHQWWGNNVTCASWSDIWVNEGFASYASHLVLEYLYPAQAPANMNDVHDNVKSIPGGSIWVTDSLNAAAIFSGRLSYDKGAAFVHTLRFLMNDDSLFFQALKEFQINYKDSLAIGLDVRNQLNMMSTVNFDDAFDQWYFGEGFPTYSTRYNTIGNDLYFEISHTSSSSTPTFTNPLEIKFSRIGLADTTIRINISSNSDHFVIPSIGGEVTSAEIDPNNWIINNVGVNVKDENYLSTQKESEAITLDVFPNPSSNEINITINNQGKNNIQLINMQGKSVLSKSFNIQTKINISNYESGFYIVKITNNTGNQWIKTIVKN